MTIMVEIELEGRKYKISETGSKEIYDEKVRGHRMKYRVKVDWNGIESISFNFTSSVHDLEWKGKTEMDDSDKITAFHSYLSDGLMFLDVRNIQEFADEFCEGDPEQRECKIAYNATHRSAEKLRSKFGLDRDRIANMMNEIQEKYPDSV